MKRVLIVLSLGIFIASGLITESVFSDKYNYVFEVNGFVFFFAFLTIGALGSLILVHYKEIWEINKRIAYFIWHLTKNVASFVWRPINRELVTRQIKKVRELYEMEVYSEQEYNDKLEKLKLKL